MDETDARQEDWELLKSFFPKDWRDQARAAGALKGLRQDKSEENYLRILMIHFGCGYSMRETVVRARQAQLADLSDVALLKRLRKSKEWLYGLCRSLFEERGVKVHGSNLPPMRLIDATQVKEPGKTGSLWRIHYSLRWPSLRCDYFKLTATEGEGTAESLQRFPLKAGDHILADRGYSHASGIHYASGKGAFVTIRFNPQGLRVLNPNRKRFVLSQRLKSVQKTGQIGCWKVLIPWEENSPVLARLCVVRKTQEAIGLAHKKLRRKASKNGTQLQPETLLYAEYVMVLSTFAEDRFPASLALEWYRLRWQVELVFKRFKQIAQLGHLPKYDEESAKAWLYGKLFVALLTEKLITHARALSPWGYELEKISPTQPVA
jgi:hypothetical protein